jgi:hypothetical protein
MGVESGSLADRELEHHALVQKFCDAIGDLRKIIASSSGGASPSKVWFGVDFALRLALIISSASGVIMQQAAGAKDELLRARRIFLELRALHRSMVQSGEESREATGAHRQQIDAQGLQLQNVLYEKISLQKEIRDCRAFRWVACIAETHPVGRAV